jgi:hypothetical protein
LLEQISHFSEGQTSEAMSENTVPELVTPSEQECMGLASTRASGKKLH